MALKLLCAGCSKDEREHAEAAVRKALGRRAEGGVWTVSLVKMGGQWSVTLDAPSSGIRALTLVAAQGRLREAIAQAIQGPAPAPPAQTRAAAPDTRRSPEPPRPAREGRSRWECDKCRRAFVVIYEARPDESQESVPVACPHCWQVNRVLVGESAAEAKDYRAEKA